MVNRKRAKKRMKRTLLKRYKQTAKVPVIVESPNELKNNEYQSLLDIEYGKGIITPVERFISNQATLIHICSECSKKFYAKPSYLLKVKHECSSSAIDSSLNYPKKSKNKISKNNVNGKELALSLDRMIKKGVKHSVIQQKTGVSRQILNWYIGKFHAEVK